MIQSLCLVAFGLAKNYCYHHYYFQGALANATDDGWPGSLGDWWRGGIEDDQKQKYVLYCLIFFLKKKNKPERDICDLP